MVWAESSAAAASDNSPVPWSNEVWLRPTPRKLKRSTESRDAERVVALVPRSDGSHRAVDPADADAGSSCNRRVLLLGRVRAALETHRQGE